MLIIPFPPILTLPLLHGIPQTNQPTTAGTDKIAKTAACSYRSSAVNRYQISNSQCPSSESKLQKFLID